MILRGSNLVQPQPAGELTMSESPNPCRDVATVSSDLDDALNRLYQAEQDVARLTGELDLIIVAAHEAKSKFNSLDRLPIDQLFGDIDSEGITALKQAGITKLGDFRKITKVEFESKLAGAPPKCIPQILKAIGKRELQFLSA